MEQLISHSAVGILLSVGKYTGYSYMSLLLSDCPSVLSSLYPLFLFMISTPHALQGLIVYKRKFYNICADDGCLWKLTQNLNNAQNSSQTNVRGDGQGFHECAANETEKGVSGNGESVLGWIPLSPAVVLGLHTPLYWSIASVLSLEEADHSPSGDPRGWGWGNTTTPPP